MADLFRLHKDAQFSTKIAGQEQQPVLQVDNFMQEASVLRRCAVELNAFEAADNYYPGIRMEIPAAYTLSAAKHLEAHIRELFGMELRNLKRAVSRYSIVTKPPDALDFFQRIPHFDSPTRFGLAMIHYLSEGDFSGTAFYRYEPLGYEYVDAERYEPYMKDVKARFRDCSHWPQGYIAGDTECFRTTFAADAKFNRVLMYRGCTLHSGIIDQGYAFDPSPATGRLTVTTFLEFHPH